MSLKKLTIDGHDVKEMPKQATREHMGIVLQDPVFLAGRSLPM